MDDTNESSHPLVLTRPDDWHVHLRDGDYLSRTVSDCARVFARAIVMPNLQPPVTTVAKARAYRTRIETYIPKSRSFTPLMTLYLTDETTPDIIREAAESDIVYAAKLYPAHATTHAQAGVRNINALAPVLAEMQAQQLPLLIHGEVVDPQVDIFDQEARFIDKYLVPLTQHFPQLKIVLEHITTQDAVDFIKEGPQHRGATITAHHLLLNRNDMLKGGIRPHYYCLPILKRDTHQRALIKAATSGDPHFFLGTDSAPHAQTSKENQCGCAGIYTAHAAIELYAEVFEAANALESLEAFASFNGADFYGLERNLDKITLKKQIHKLPDSLNFGKEALIPMRAGQSVTWQMVDET